MSHPLRWFRPVVLNRHAVPMPSRPSPCTERSREWAWPSPGSASVGPGIRADSIRYRPNNIEGKQHSCLISSIGQSQPFCDLFERASMKLEGTMCAFVTHAGLETLTVHISQQAAPAPCQHVELITCQLHELQFAHISSKAFLSRFI